MKHAHCICQKIVGLGTAGVVFDFSETQRVSLRLRMVVVA